MSGLEEELNSLRLQLTEKVTQVELLKSESERGAQRELEHLRNQLEEKQRVCVFINTPVYMCLHYNPYEYPL